MNIKLAVIDTGIERKHPWLEDCVINGVGLSEEKGKIRFSSSFDDLLGHGTSVASVLHSFCPEALIYGVCIAQKNNENIQQIMASEALLAAAIDWCLTQEISIINISYSMELLAKGGVLEQACNEAFEQGCVVLGSYRNGSKPYYPAGLSTVLGVHRSVRCEPGEVIIISEDDNNVASWGGPVDVAYKNGTVARFKGSSYACPTVAAMVGRMLQIEPELRMTNIMKYLSKLDISAIKK